MNSFIALLKRILENRRLLRKWRRTFTFLASVVVFVTSYMMILPAISVEKNKTESVSGIYLEDADIIDETQFVSASNMDFKYACGDDLILTGGFIQKNLNANKSIYVEREIGQRPVLAFGNSGSDTSMMNYAIDDRNPYPAEAYMIVADDSVREWGTQDWTEKSTEFTEMGYVPISMANDFAEIYPSTITKADEQYHEREQAAEAADEEAESEEIELDAAA